MSEIVVAYFSATGTTAKLAKKIANVVDGDLHEILPEISYTPADLDWMNKESRSSVEMNDKSFRPAIANKLESAESIKMDLCQYFGQKKLKDYATFFSSSSSFLLRC